MGLKRVAPPEGTYKYVLKRDDRDPNLEHIMVCYNEVAQSRDITFRGKRGPTVFSNSKVNRDRHVKLGWLDITDEWLKSLEPPVPVVSDRPKKARVKSRKAS